MTASVSRSGRRSRSRWHAAPRARCQSSPKPLPTASENWRSAILSWAMATGPQSGTKPSPTVPGPGSPVRSRFSGSGRSRCTHRVIGQPVASTPRYRMVSAATSIIRGTPATSASPASRTSTSSSPGFSGPARQTASNCPASWSRSTDSLVLAARFPATTSARCSRSASIPTPVAMLVANSGTPARPSESSSCPRCARQSSRSAARIRSTWFSTTAITSPCRESGLR